MAAVTIESNAARSLRATRLLGRVGHWGALLTLAILAASVLLRLSTAIDAEGVAHSRLPEAVETIARLAHRIAAMAVTVLALLAAMVAFSTRPVPLARIAAVTTIVAVTIFLAILGRYTPGYKSAAVTLGNVIGGLALVSAFWWLREGARGATTGPGQRAAAMAWLAFVGLLAQSSLGAATSALAMRGVRTLDLLHLAIGLLFLVLVGLAAWPHRNAPDSAVIARAGAALAAIQFAIGLFLANADSGRPWALAWLHALVACALAMALVALASRAATGK